MTKYSSIAFRTSRNSSATPVAVACDLAALAPFRDWGLDTLRVGGAMKLKQPREAMPLMVWMALALMAIAAVAYLTGIFIMEDVLAFF